MRTLLVCMLAGCGFSPHEATSDAPRADTNPGDGSGSNNEFAPEHLTSADGKPGTQSLVLSGNTVLIDTTTLTIQGVALEAGTFDARPQVAPGGPQVAVLHVQQLRVAAGSRVLISGTRPFIVVASDRIEIDGVLDVGAHGITPGAGGYAPGM